MANKANLANSVLFAPLSDSDTELEVYTGDGALFPAAPFYLTLSPKNKWSRKINSEIVLVTAKSTDTFTITRAQKGTTAKEFSYGDLIANGIYVEDFTDLEDYVDNEVDAGITAAVSAALQAMMPVGFVVTLGVSTNPATLYGFGTWTRIQGRVVVGVSDSDSDFDLNDTGGSKTHAHNLNGTGFARITGEGTNMRMQRVDGTGTANLNHLQTGFSSASFSDYNTILRAALDGTTATVSNMQPFISKYVWERTA